jgi:ABC-type nickel/cobalt efflux system permease component RcnA
VHSAHLHTLAPQMEVANSVVCVVVWMLLCWREKKAIVRACEMRDESESEAAAAAPAPAAPSRDAPLLPAGAMLA